MLSVPHEFEKCYILVNNNKSLLIFDLAFEKEDKYYLYCDDGIHRVFNKPNMGIIGDVSQGNVFQFHKV